MNMKPIALAAAAAIALAGCATDGSYDGTSRTWRQYDYNRPDPAYGDYDAGRYHREGKPQRERQLSANERIYRGKDGQYYCRRSDGSTGLIVGALAGGVLGNVIAPGGSEVFGTILGAGAGALAGRAIDRKSARCR
jgi:outer membrane lipoprotein SlyB